MLQEIKILHADDKKENEAFVKRLKAEKIVAYWTVRHKRSQIKDPLVSASRRTVLIAAAVRLGLIVFSSFISYQISTHSAHFLTREIDALWFSVSGNVQSSM